LSPLQIKATTSATITRQLDDAVIAKH